MKFVANHLVAIHNVAAAEAMNLARHAGLDPKIVVDTIGAGGSWMSLRSFRFNRNGGFRNYYLSGPISAIGAGAWKACP